MPRVCPAPFDIFGRASDTNFFVAAHDYLSKRRRSVIFLQTIRCLWHVQINGAVMSEIFIVDDDPLIDTALAMALNSEGFNVVNFVEGESFLNVGRRRGAHSGVFG